jgi:hypothetical protein
MSRRFESEEGVLWTEHLWTIAQTQLSGGWKGLVLNIAGSRSSHCQNTIVNSESVP